MNINELEQLIEEVELVEEGKLKPIERGKGLIAYRNYLWALKHIEEKIIRLKEYKQQVIEDIDKGIEKQEQAIWRIKNEIKDAMIQEPLADRTKSGGRLLSLPDIASVSLSKLKSKIEIVDEQLVLKALGQEFSKVKISLDKPKVKKYILETGKMPEGAAKKQERTLSIRFKR